MLSYGLVQQAHMRSHWIRRVQNPSCWMSISKRFVVSKWSIALKWNMYSDVQVKSSQNSVLWRYTRLNRIALLYLHHYSPQLHSTSPATSPHLYRDHVAGDWLRDVIWSATRRNMQFVVTSQISCLRRPSTTGLPTEHNAFLHRDSES